MPSSSALARPYPTSLVSSPGPPAESAYTKVRHFEGETLSVLCSYKGYRNRVDGKVWCKIRRRKCEPGFTRVWVEGPRYLLQDDAQAKVVNITMAALTLQDSGRYWCMRNSSGTLYPMLGIWLDVSPESLWRKVAGIAIAEHPFLLYLWTHRRLVLFSSSMMCLANEI
uniref:Trem-like transcript 2 protein n=1 Tax=Callithrix jacchus TaxID=9483 RepID=A0A8I3WMH0_CALJA